MVLILRGHPGLATLASCFLLFSLHPAAAFGNDCRPADIELTSQEAVDNFQANHGGAEVCTMVTGKLHIGSFTDIVNLDGLAALERVGGDLVIDYNESLSDIRGLTALAFIGGDLYIGHNWNLLALDGLSALTSIGGSLVLNGMQPYMGQLQNIDGLSVLSSVGGDLIIEHNYYLQQIDGLRNLTRINGKLRLYQNSILESVEGLRAVTEVGTDLAVVRSYKLINLDGLRSLTRVGGKLVLIELNDLPDLNGLSSLRHVGGALEISDNEALANLDGLASVPDVEALYINANGKLGNCLGVVRLIDPIDDYAVGPASAGSPMPDVNAEVEISQNAKGCNSVDEVLGSAPLYGLNAGLNDAWFDPATNGQGFFITVFPKIGQVFLSWFTYDISRPPDDLAGFLGDPGHRWLTAQGDYLDNSALLELWTTSGGIFDSGTPEPEWQRDGEILLDFTTCNSAMIHYDIPSVNRQGSIPLERIVLDNVAPCYMLNASQAHKAKAEDQ